MPRCNAMLQLLCFVFVILGFANLLQQMVKELREATRAAKRQKAQLQREKALKAMGKRSQVYSNTHTT
jgi:Sec-independent protein translocase protein TatA